MPCNPTDYSKQYTPTCPSYDEFGNKYKACLSEEKTKGTGDTAGIVCFDGIWIPK